jgi:hypothetical protein
MTGMFALLFVVFCEGGGLCDELITRLQKSNRLSVSNCVTSGHIKNMAAKFYLGCCATKEKNTFQKS